MTVRMPALRGVWFTPQTRFRALAAFIVLAFCLGGGSRHDIVSLMVLRPLAFGFMFYALMAARAGDLHSVRVPLQLVLALAVWQAVQLLPLPPAIWQQLSGRSLFAQIHNAAGLEGVWLPLTISPSRTLNSLMSLSVPLAALLLFAVQEPARRVAVLRVVWAMALVSVVLGIAQITGPNGGPLYLYRITNDGLPVGLFANRNHQALMVCVGVLLSGYLAAASLAQGRDTGWLLAAGGAVLLLVPFLLVAGSRAGLVLAVAAIPAAAVVVHLAQAAKRDVRRPWLAGAAFAAMLALLLGAFIAQSRGLALDRLLASGGEGELRASAWPVLADMMAQHWLLGTGFGSFELAFKQVEPLGLLRPDYLNQAHNDLAQWVIEGGLPAIAIMLAFVAWLAQRIARLGGTIRNGTRPEVLVSILALGACALASLVDYPLRVPSLMVVFALACGFVAVAVPEERRARLPADRRDHASGPAFQRT